MPRSEIELRSSGEPFQCSAISAIWVTHWALAEHAILPHIAMMGRPSHGQALAAPMVGSECPGSSRGKRVASLYVGDLRAESVSILDS